MYLLLLIITLSFSFSFMVYRFPLMVGNFYGNLRVKVTDEKLGNWEQGWGQVNLRTRLWHRKTFASCFIPMGFTRRTLFRHIEMICLLKVRKWPNPIHRSCPFLSKMSFHCLNRVLITSCPKIYRTCNSKSVH